MEEEEIDVPRLQAPTWWTCCDDCNSYLVSTTNQDQHSESMINRGPRRAMLENSLEMTASCEMFDWCTPAKRPASCRLFGLALVVLAFYIIAMMDWNRLVGSCWPLEPFLTPRPRPRKTSPMIWYRLPVDQIFLWSFFLFAFYDWWATTITINFSTTREHFSV